MVRQFRHVWLGPLRCTANGVKRRGSRSDFTNGTSQRYSPFGRKEGRYRPHDVHASASNPTCQKEAKPEKRLIANNLGGGVKFT